MKKKMDGWKALEPKEPKVEEMACIGLAVAVYKNPSIGSARVGQIGFGVRVSVVAKDGDWVRIESPDGWVPAAFLG